MMYPERFSNLPEATWPRLRGLLDSITPGDTPNVMTIGEPRHDFPEWVPDVIAQTSDLFGKYPSNEGTPELLDASVGFLKRRYGVDVGRENVVTLNGTREGLYNAAMVLCPEQKNGQKPIILTPNPFYQVYMLAALSVGAEPVYVPVRAETQFLPDLMSMSEDVLSRTAIAYVCSPSNPQGAIASCDYWRDVIGLAEEYDFKIFADECYSEIYRNDAPVGAMQVAQEMGADPERVVIFHSLSKRSNLPGLRSGFAASGSENIKQIRMLRAYAGAPVPMPLQAVAARAWADDAHSDANRALYQEKYAIADQVFGGIQGFQGPEGGFFLWLPVDNGEDAAVKAWREVGVKTLPGAYLSKEENGTSPGHGYVRVAMVAEKQEMQRGLIALRDCLYR
ncbi:aminotransferase class I/II-fold pyridoxal phosphate-dependent enzyme [Thalassobium sp. R2A62]|uniref:aminotransferase class I/II-fold pyridoxal phosphate-dependent enzyme n=1 Tax=Thalassobium sp. R2A62 TaxID=633131 RepID=UPI0001B1CD76|nr:aminotransferase class I/II-fold pyridoxal phosphate-dependent enzyme [Thalassobium sp. R2A62]EET48382.1 aminotransferase, classes I and II [Thalassobium sp. R2A62]